jgi:hypothetical protein
VSKLPAKVAYVLRTGLNLAYHRIETGDFDGAADMLSKATRTLRRAARYRSKKQRQIR